MKIPFKFLVLVVLFPMLAVSAQESGENTDPTTESPEIRERLDTIRGVEGMKLLQKQNDELSSQKQKLLQEIATLNAQLDAMRQGQEEVERRWTALPEFQLVAQIRSGAMLQAEISGAGRTYRVVDGRPFRLVLSNDEILNATPRFQEDGTIEIVIEDIETPVLLVFRPSAPDPENSKSDNGDKRGDDDN